MSFPDLQSLFTGIEASTPDGRWNILQEWLVKNPNWKDEVNTWLDTPSDEVVKQLIDSIANRFDMSPDMVQILTPSSIKDRARSVIEKIQACYRERQAYDNQPIEKEIKHDNTSRTVRRRKQRTS